jgi:hypothetical protein
MHASTQARVRTTKLETQQHAPFLMAGFFDPVVPWFMNVWMY